VHFMAMATKAVGRPQATLWNMYRHEIFKTRKQLFYKVAFLFPIILNVVFLMSALIISITSKIPFFQMDKPVNPTSQTPYDLGSGGTFTAMAGIVLHNLAPIYNVIIVIACAMLVASEYRNGTIKMVATRQPSRVRLVLAKCLTALTFVTVISLVFLISWLLIGLIMKPVSNLPLEITAQDWDAIGKTIYFHTIKTIQLVILALLAVALTFKVKSAVAGIIGYFVLVSADGVLGGMGAGLIKNGIPAITPDWQKPIYEVVRFIHPYLLGSNVDRLTQARYYESIGFDPVIRAPANAIIENQRVNFDMSATWSWAMLAVYVALLIGYTCWTFARRDIDD
jgi:ABC-type transport system involved in multi-copper enzyme maturation permease subunit